jgi:DNA-binding FrmR family transcriptional regulator
MKDWMVTIVAPGCIEKKHWVLRSLRRFVDPIRGLQGIFDGGRYRFKVLDQSSATANALQAVALELLDVVLAHCAGVDSFDACAGGRQWREVISFRDLTSMTGSVISFIDVD